QDKGQLAERALRRPPSYKDPAELAAQFRRRFKRWTPESYEQMARATLRHDAARGEWLLACPREYEAHIFSSSAETDIWNGMRNCAAPFKLFCGDPQLE